MKKFLFIYLLIGFALSLPIIANGQKAIKIDCNTPAYLPDEKAWSIDPSSKNGIYEYNPSTVRLINLSDKNSNIKTSLLTEKIKNEACPAQVLDYLLAHQNLIPVEWQGKTIIFTGTLYNDATGLKCYRTMVFWDGRWDWNRAYPEDRCDNCASIVVSN